MPGWLNLEPLELNGNASQRQTNAETRLALVSVATREPHLVPGLESGARIDWAMGPPSVHRECTDVERVDRGSRHSSGLSGRVAAGVIARRAGSGKEVQDSSTCGPVAPAGVQE